MVRQFAYVHGVIWISLLLGKKKYKVRLQFFLTQETRQQHTINPNHKIVFSTQNGPKKNLPEDVAPGPPGSLFMSTPAWAYRPKPLLHGLSLRKSPIKNHSTLFGSGQVIKPDQTTLDFTKPNTPCYERQLNRSQMKLIQVQSNLKIDI